MTDFASPAPAAQARRRLWLGIGCGLLTSLIWGVQSVVSRQSVADGLSAADVTILRFVVASLILLPLARRRMRPFPVGALGWRRALILTALAGAPYALVLVGGATFAPALHASVIVPGLIPVMTVALAFLVLGERPGPLRLLGLALVLAGIGAFGWQAFGESGAGANAWIGDLFFVTNAVMWSVFGLLALRWRTDAIDVTIATCLLSLLILPVFAATMPIRLGEVAWSAIALQALYQGALVGVGALFLYTKSVELLGAGRATLFLPLNPVVTALAAILLLGEYPSPVEIAGMVLVIAGMSVALRAR
ncbi:MAG: DMT family transporter [Bosea sp. (in: a-proteobacteria)]|uniref:DMT family transporter n=1 Tax=Bosea sp. (in: a-proteobacteria) TaxID=1871050 RepID=UPI002735BB23|nr:DMT family transporter [Bosea sp. (in: a-proteobacteria)]MDP3601420.1 DMT family transporter [Bosea sp. (in: a-proteobacteria)]